MAAALCFGDLVRDAATLADRARRLAGGLRRLGVREGDVVAVLLRNDPVYADVMLACRILGAYYCPLNWHFRTAELTFIIEDSGARALVGHADLLDAAAGAIPADVAVLGVGPASGAMEYEAWLAAQAPYNGPVVAPRGHMCYTSGTTVRPKG